MSTEKICKEAAIKCHIFSTYYPDKKWVQKFKRLVKELEQINKGD